MLDDTEYDKYCDSLNEMITFELNKSFELKSFQNLDPTDKFRAVVSTVSDIFVEFLVQPFIGNEKKINEAIEYGRRYFESSARNVRDFKED